MNGGPIDKVVINGKEFPVNENDSPIATMEDLLKSEQILEGTLTLEGDHEIRIYIRKSDYDKLRNSGGSL